MQERHSAKSFRKSAFRLTFSSLIGILMLVSGKSAGAQGAAASAKLSTDALATQLADKYNVHAKFPQGFRWCVATAAHQIEGGNTASDWWKWEQTPGHVKDDQKSGAACDHWNRIDEDIALMKSMNVTDYRMSIEWARIEPQEGQYDESAIAHYKREIDALKAANIQPILTLQHFTLPEWVREKGGFEWSGLSDAFAVYTKKAYTEIAPGVRDWVTINEPMVTMIAGYVAGVHPPQEKRSVKDIFPVVRGMAMAHARAYHVLHAEAAALGFEVRVGMANHLRTMDPFSHWSPVDRLAAAVANQAWNWMLPMALQTGRLELKLFWPFEISEEIPGLAGTQDFFGVNYYSGDLISFSVQNLFEIKTRSDIAKNDLGWDIYPEGFHRVLMDVAQKFPNMPIIITENGIADAADAQRPKFILDHLAVISQAISEGANIEGYCHWSLMDNFEWQEGFTPRFGLFEMDYKTFERKPRTSAVLYGEIAKKNGF